MSFKRGDILDINVPAVYEKPLDWERILLYYEAALEEVRTRINIIDREYKLSGKESPIEHISSRIKEPRSIMNKLNKNGYQISLENMVKHVNDVAGIRIICSFTSDIYELAACISNQDDISVLKIKDYIQNPKSNGYMSYHMILSVPVHLSESVVHTKVELQIRTSAMDFWASLEHKMYYKFSGNAPEHIRRELKECADIVAFLDRKMLSLNDEITHYRDQCEEPETKELDVNLVEEYIGVIVEDTREEG